MATRTYTRTDIDHQGRRETTERAVVVEHCNDRRGTETWVRYVEGDRANRDAFVAICRAARATFMPGIKAWSVPAASGESLLRTLRDAGYTVVLAATGMI